MIEFLAGVGFGIILMLFLKLLWSEISDWIEQKIQEELIVSGICRRRSADKKQILT